MKKEAILLEKEQGVSLFPSNPPYPPLKKGEQGISPFSKWGSRGIIGGLLFFTIYLILACAYASNLPLEKGGKQGRVFS
ncbi:hypothetical protein KSU1_D0780 [Candidatus Jettenia caeni]|uniref:Uncharacterized protein n=1 Tax=Candidatus Jettenia caeni TaxID=247490 RepID=I3IQU4_9BACT|nr:hypothetical protein KSU1_D0780 [Candidatus Jettenia caeni]GIL19382.1 MAG: hypothetical protein BroJett041_04960 [Candidatus Jettenia caeni]GJQ45040.1 MAG: hypothetical protein JETCAE04_07940 [Candidatus Jettenia caeni]